MDTTGEVRFVHRLTNHQTFECICLRCFRTVGSAKLEPDLELTEKSHTCLPEDLAVLQGKMGPESVSDMPQKKNLA